MYDFHHHKNYNFIIFKNIITKKVIKIEYDERVNNQQKGTFYET